MLTKKEANLLLREYVMKYGYDKINYTKLEEDILDVRLQLLNNRTMGPFIEKCPKGQLFQSVVASQDVVKPQMTI